MINPYQAPESAQRDVNDRRAGRPIAVWLVLLMLSVITLLFAAGLARSILFIASHLSDVGNYFALIVAIVWRAVLLAGALYAIVCVWRRRPLGRWLGLLALAALLVLILFIPDTTQYASATERAGGVFARMILLPALMAWWGYQFGFSANARRYFADARLAN